MGLGRCDPGAVTEALHGKACATLIPLLDKEEVIGDVRTNHMITTQTGRKLGRLQRRIQSGMTLVEVTVAMAITGLAVGGIINGYNFCTSSARKAALLQAANARAMERIEETRSAIWDTAQYPVVDQLAASNFPSKVVTLDLSGSGGVSTTATVQTEISQISLNPPLKRVRVDCLWQHRGGQWVTNTVESCRAPGP
jgi:prepilin-type N-terminal cleavage/methylation domain-containing protein